MNQKQIFRLLYPLFAILFWIALWWILALCLGKPLLLPTPWQVIKKLGELMLSGSFWLTVITSLARILCGIAAALLGGTLLALLTVRFRLLHHLFSPLLALFKSTPVASVIFLLLLWVGRDTLPLLIAFMMALPIVWSNMREGLLSTDQKLLEMARAFQLPPQKNLLYIRLPALSPYFLAACRSALALAWKAGIAAEILSLPAGSIGRLIYQSKLYLLTDELFAYTLTVVLISVLIEQFALALFNRAQKRLQEVHTDA